MCGVGGNVCMYKSSGVIEGSNMVFHALTFARARGSVEN